MTFQYTWLKILEVLAKGRRQMTADELRAELGRRGFLLDEKTFQDSIERLREQGLVEALVLAGGGHDTIASVAITDRGEKKVRSIVRF